MKITQKVVTAALLFAAIAAPSVSKAAGSVGGVFLIMDTSARCAGMGSACIASSNDAASVNINPAAMTERAGKQALFMHNESLLDISQEYISYTSSVGDKAMGASLVYLDLGTQQGYTALNVPTGAFKPNSYAFTFAYGVKISSELSYGAGLKYIREKIASETGSAFALDAGVLYKPKAAPWRAAAVIQNFGTKLKLGSSADPLPLTIKVGGAYTMKKTPLTLTSDAFFIKGYSPEYHVGAEYLVNNFIALRAGYNTADDLDNGFTFGLGVSQEKYGIDYAFVPMGVFGDSHRFAFSSKF